MRVLVLLSIVLLAACDNQSSNQSAGPAEAPNNAVEQAPVEAPEPTQDEETANLTAWLDEQYEQQLAFSPETRTTLGDKTDYGQLDDRSLAALDEELEWLQSSVASMREQFEYDRLTEDGKLSWDMWLYTLEQAEAALPWREHAYIFGRGGPHASLPTFMITYHGVETEQDLADYVSRLRQMDDVLYQLLDRAQQSAADGIRQPRFAYGFAMEEIDRVTSGVPFNSNDGTPNSPLWSDFQGKAEALVEDGVLSDEQLQNYLGEARDVLAGEVMNAYQAVRQGWKKISSLPMKSRAASGPCRWVMPIMSTV
jgi:uncharacterized protein (DUF885 family)